MFGDWSKNSHLYVTSSHFNLPRQLGSKRGIYEVSHSIKLFNKVDALAKKFDQLVCMNKVFNAPSMQDVSSICGCPMHTFVDYPCVVKSDYVTKEVNANQVFPLPNSPCFDTYNHGWRNHPNFL